jgi:hypothetical protein
MGDAFDSISGSPDPALSERVRSALVEAPEQRGPVWIGALAATVIAVILVGILLVGNPLNRGQVPGGGGNATPSPSAPTASPSPTGAPFDCAVGSSTLTNQVAPPTALIDAVRTGSHAGYDRLTIEFQNGTTGTIKLVPQANTRFITDPKGDTVTLAGKYGLLVRIAGADNHTAFVGSTDIKSPNFPGILEVRQIGDFEGVVQWAVGLSSSPCIRTDILSAPTRLVIDIQTN